MIGAASDASTARDGRAARHPSRRGRRNLVPGAEPLEIRDCPSATGIPAAATQETALLRQQAARTAEVQRHEAQVAHRLAPREARAAHRLAPREARATRKKAGSRSPLTVYVAPQGGTSARAGRTASRPMDLATALRRAASGATIILAPGTYTENAILANKSNITILGAANQASVLTPSGGDALRVVSSTNVTINGLAFRGGDRGVVDFGSSVNLANVRTSGTNGDGAVAVSYGGQSASLGVASSQFGTSGTGNGLELQDGSSAVITGSTFNGNGTAGGSIPGGSGLLLAGNARADIADSQFVGNLNSNLVAFNQSQVNARGSTFSNSLQGNGAIFADQSSVQLTGDTFATNGQVVGYASGFNGVEFKAGFTGTAVVAGNTFRANTASGIFVGGSSQTLQITGNTFDSNLIGLDMDGSYGTINAVIQGNTFVAPPGGGGAQGIVANGSTVTATIGGSGSLQNVFENFPTQWSILPYRQGGSPTRETGFPNFTILGNIFLNNGQPVDPSQAILPRY